MAGESSFENQAGAGEAGLGFLEFGDVEGSEVETCCLDAGARAWEGCRENNCVVEGKSVGGVGFGGVNVNPVVGGKGRRIEPGAVGEERVATEVGDGGPKVETAGDGDGDDFITVRSEDGRELADTFGIAALGKADEEFAANAENVSTFECAGKRDVFEFAKFRDGLRERCGFGAPRFCAERKNYGEFIEDNGGIFDEHGIGEVGLGGEGNNAGAEFCEQLLVGAVLGAGNLKIDRLTLNETQFAVYDCGTDGACDGCEHVGRASLHEKPVKD